MTLKVFISYKSEYRSFARALQTRLKDWGYPTWLDVDNIRPGEYFRHKIQEGLDTSDALVVVLTEEAQQSREVMAEVDYFLGQQNKPVVPLRHQDCKPLYIFVSIQYIDFVNNESSGFEALRVRLAELAAAQAAPAELPGAPPAAILPAEPPKPVVDELNRQKADLQTGQSSTSIPAPQPIVPETDMPPEEAAEQIADVEKKRESPPPPPPAPIIAPSQPAAPQRRQEETVLTDVLSYPRQPAAQAPARKSALSRWPLLAAAAMLLLAIAVVPELLRVATTPPEITTVNDQNGSILLLIIGLLVLAAGGAFIWLRRRAPRTTAPESAPLTKPQPLPPVQNRPEAQTEPQKEDALAAGILDDDEFAEETAPVPAGAVLRHRDYGEYPLKDQTLVQVFDDLLGQMLLLGSADARERALVALTMALLARAKADDMRTVPLPIRLDEWPVGSQTFESWLAALAISVYAIPDQAAQEWVEYDQLTLLVDGLEKMTAEQQAHSLTALQTYRRAHPKVDVVIGGTAADFDRLARLLDIRGAIVLA